MGEWISVEDGLPECGIPVLGAQREYLEPEGDWFYLVYELDQEGEWFDPSEDGNPDEMYQVFSPSHWMPLPEPPEK